MLMAGVQDQQIDLSRDPMMTMYMVGASQTFVRGERRECAAARGAARNRAAGAEAESRRAEITRDVLMAYDEAAAAKNQIAANEEIAKLAVDDGRGGAHPLRGRLRCADRHHSGQSSKRPTSATPS